MDWPSDKIEKRKISELIPYARNARTHSDEQVAQLAASIKEWGWTTPVLIDEDGEIIAGHGRVLAARKLDIDKIPTMTATGWTKAQKQAYVLADNQLPLNAGWDMDLLSVEMKDLDGDGFDLSLVGFSLGEATQILNLDAGENNPDAEWDGMPEFDQEDKRAFRSIVVHFNDQKAVDMFCQVAGQKISEKTKMLWYPEIEIETIADKSYV
jgi:hypothetical protein|tara:strand:+ start:220 stop:849 length:630 start_codon:yes stop_codon:yes gene_type:complete